MQELTLPIPTRTTITPTDYETDFVAWIEQQATLLQLKDFASLDLANLIEELNAMGRSERQQLSNRLRTILLHLLKCEFQPERKSASWRGTLREQRTRLSRLLLDSPSLRRHITDFIDADYSVAATRAADETGLAISIFPAEIPYSVDQILDLDFIP